MGRGPKVKDLVAIPASRCPSFEKTADTPCRLSKAARAEVLSASSPYDLEDAGAFAST
jgi:hypothetical protein